MAVFAEKVIHMEHTVVSVIQASQESIVKKVPLVYSSDLDSNSLFWSLDSKHKCIVNVYSSSVFPLHFRY